MSRDYYEILEVHLRATEEIVDKAYRILAKRYHPDKHSPDKQKWAHTKFKELSEAYNILSHSDLRKKYDRDLGKLKQPEPHQDQASSYNHISDREKAYFHYRTGLKYFEQIRREAFFYCYSGRWEDDLLLAENNFLEVIQSYPHTGIVETANFYYFCCMAMKFDYISRHLEKVEREYNFLKKNYPHSKWGYQADFEMARFYFLKAFRPQQSAQILENLLNQPLPDKIKTEAEILLACVLEEIQ